MTPSRVVRAFAAVLLATVLPILASAATTEFRVLFDVDNDPATGCTVNGMDGVDQVLVTEVTDDGTTARVTRTHRQVCGGGALGAPVDIDTTGWDATWDGTNKQVTLETRIPFTAFGGPAMPSGVHVGFDATRNATIHTALANSDGTPVLIPAPPVRRRAVHFGADRHITMDGQLADWGNLRPVIFGIASAGSLPLRLLSIYAWPDPGDGHLYFAATAYLGSDHPWADDDVYLRQPGQNLSVNLPGVLGNDGIPSGAPLTAQQVSDPARGTVVLNADGSFTYSPNHPQLLTSDEFEYRAIGDGKQSNVARVIIQVGEGGPNTPVDDEYTTPEDTKKIVPGPGVLANDPHTELLVASLFSAPSHGTVVINADGGFTYTPKKNFNGTDSFVYTATKVPGAPQGIGGNATVTITVTPVNDPPVMDAETFTIPENSPNNTVVGTVDAFDVDGNLLTYSIVGGNTGGAFSINSSTGQIRVANSAALDFETNPTFLLIVRAEDADDGDEATITINLTDTNEPPVVVAGGTLTYTENDPASVIDGTLTVSDTDSAQLVGATVQISANFASGQDLLAFTPVGAITGVFAGNTLTLSGNDTPANYQLALRSVTYQNTSDNPSVAPRTITWIVNDGTFTSAPVTSTVNVISVNDTPSDIALSGSTVAENQPAGTALGTFSSTDLDLGETFTYTLVAGAGDTGNASFQLVGDQLQTAASFDFETQNSYSIRVRTTDSGGLFFEEVFTITVTDVNDAPTDIALSNATAPENQAPGTTIGTLSTTDQDAGDTFTYTLVSGTGSADNASFQIVGNAVQNAVNLDFEAQPSYSIRVRSTDAGGLFFEEAFTISLTNVNETPTDIALDNASVAENQPAGTAVGNLTTTDPDAGDTFTYTLVAGAGDTGNASFQIVGGQLQTSAMFDFELQNSYSIRLRSTDAGGLFFEEAFTISVVNVNETPTDIALSGTTVAENQPSGTGVGSLSTTDQDAGDTFTYTLVAGTGDTGNTSFQIAGNQLQTGASFDFETQNSYSIRVRTTDAGGLFYEEVFTITVTDGNETPTDIQLSNASAPENQAVGTDIGTLTTTDPDAGDTFTYTLVAGTGDTDNASFQIAGDKLQNATNLDFDAQPTYSVRVRSTDAGGLFFEEVFTITLTNVNETPTDIALSNASVNENQPSGTAVGNLSTTDPDAGDTFTYTLVAGTGDTGNASFQIVGGQLQTAAVFDTETQGSYSIRVRSTDAGGLFFEEVFTITVTNVNEAPTDIALSASAVAENQPAGTAVGTLSTTDVDAGDTFTYTLVAGAGDTGNASFQIVGNQLQTSAVFDVETQNSYSVRVRSTDAGGLFFEEVFVITVINVAEAPTDIALSNSTAPENQAIGTTIGTFSSTDQDVGDTHTYTLVAGTGDADNAKFQIVGNALQNAVNLDFDTQPSYSIRVRSTDAGALFYEEVFTITVTNVNETPTDISLSNASVAENQPSGTAVGNFSTIDPDAGDTFTYTLVAGTGDTGNTSFQIVGGQLQTSAAFDFETQNSYSIRVRTTDLGGLFFEEVFTISVTNVNETPTDIQLSNASTPENNPVGTDIGTLTTTDPDAGDTFTYTLVAGTGDTDNASFQIVGDKLQNATNLNFEAQSTYSVRIRTTDAGGLFYEEVFTITVTDANDAPTDLTLSNATVNENQPSGTAVGTFTTTDQEGGQTHTYTLVAGAGDTGNASFQIIGNQLQTAATFDFETQSSYSIRVRTTDDGVPTGFYEEVFTINVSNVNEAPTDIALSNSSVAENQPGGTAVGNFSTTDPDTGDTFTYTLVAGVGDTGNASFQIVGGQLQTSASFNFEAQNSYSIRIRSTDAGGLFFEEAFTINVTNVNETPTDIALSNASINENSGVNAVIGTLSTTDPDSPDTHTYTLVAGTGDTNNALFNINGSQLRENASLDFEAGSSYSVRIRTTDAGGLFYEEAFTITVVDVNEAPTAVLDSYNAVGGTLVHITGSVTLPVPAPVASTGDVAGSPRTTGVKANDTDPDTNPAFNTLTVTFVTGNAGPVAVPGGGQATTTTANGSVTMHSDGSFHYTPNAGYLGADSFTYTINDALNNATGTVNFTVHAPAIRYVKNDVLVAGNGTSVSPHQTLAAAITASTAGELIYVMRGDGTANNYGGSNVMKLNQKLWGQQVPLSVTANSVALNLIAATSHSLIGPGGAQETIRIQNAVTGVDIQGLSINGGTTNAVDLTTTGANSAGFTFSNNIVTAATLEGIDVNAGGSGTATVGINDSSFTTTGTAIDLTRTAGTLIIRTFDDLTVSGNTGGSGIVVTGPATFDSDAGTAGNQVVSGGATAIGTFANPIGTNSTHGGLSMTQITGSLSYTDLDVYSAGYAVLFQGTGSGTSGISVTPAAPDGIGTSTLNAAAGAGLDASSAAIDFRLADFDSTTTGTALSLSAVTGQFRAPSGSTISKSSGAGTAFRILGGSPTVNYAGTFSVTSGSAVGIGDGTLANNTTATVTFSGGLTINTGTSDGFAANNTVLGGTLVITDPAGATNNTITTTSGRGLQIENMNIGASGVTFERISTNGAVNGIRLVNNGSSGFFTITGTGADDSGGTIASSSGDGIFLSATRNITLSEMSISNSSQSHIDAANVNGLTINGMETDTSSDHGFLGSSVTNLVISGGTFHRGGAGAEPTCNKDGFNITNLLGTSSISGSTFTRSNTRQFYVLNNATSGGTDTLTVTNTNWNTHTGPCSGDHLLTAADTGSNFKLVTNSSAGNNVFSTGGSAVQLGAQGSGFAQGDIAAIQASGNTAAVVVVATATSSVRFNVHNNTANGTGSVGLILTCTTSGTCEGQFDTNTVTHTAGTATNAMQVVVEGNGTGKVTMSNNTVSGNFQRGLHAQSRAGTGSLALHVTGNNFTATDAAGLQVMNLEVGASGGGTTNSMCLNLANNTATPAGAMSAYRLLHRTGYTYQLQNLVQASTTNTADVQTWVTTTKSNAGTPVAVTIGTTPYTTSAGCAVPVLP